MSWSTKCQWRIVLLFLPNSLRLKRIWRAGRTYGRGVQKRSGNRRRSWHRKSSLPMCSPLIRRTMQVFVQPVTADSSIFHFLRIIVVSGAETTNTILLFHWFCFFTPSTMRDYSRKKQRCINALCFLLSVLWGKNPRLKAKSLGQHKKL